MESQWQDFLMSQGAYFQSNGKVDFGDSLQEIKAIDHQNCLIDLSDQGLLKVQGPDAKSFLQGQITCNLEDISPQTSAIGAHCNLQGRMQSLFRLFQVQQNNDYTYYLCMPKTMIPHALNAFKKYALFSKVALSDASSDLIPVGLYGAQAMALLASANNEDEPIFLKVNECVIKKSNIGDYFLIRLPSTHMRYLMLAPFVVMKNLWLKLTQYFKPTTSEAWQLIDIKEGIPAIFPGTMDQILPHHANLTVLQGVSFNKGCYLGQEIIARMQYKGKIKKHMYRYSINDSHTLPQIGESVFIGQTLESCGIVVRSSASNEHPYELLAVIDEQAAQSNDLYLRNAQGPKLHYLELPYTW